MINRLLLNYTRNFPIENGKKYIAARIKLPSQVVEYTNRYGAKFLLDTNEYQMKQIYLYDLYEKNTIRHLIRRANPDYVFFDVGSNIGFYALTFATLLKKGAVHCFEPNHLSFQRLSQNLSLNKFTNVILNQVGLSDSETDKKSTFNLLNTGTASIYKGEGGDNQLSEMVHLIRADDYCNQHNIEKIDFIKVDIEGGEFSFMKGAEYIIKNSRKLMLAVEMADENFREAGYSSEELFNYIISLGFKAYLPKSFPFGLKPVETISKDYFDNIIFLRGY